MTQATYISRLARVWLFPVVLLVLIAALTPVQALAEAGVIQLSEQSEPDDLLRKMILVNSNQRDLVGVAGRLDLIRDFANLPRELPPKVALNPANVWQIVELTNTSDKTLRRLLDTNEPFRGAIDIWLYQDGKEALLLSARRPSLRLDQRTVPERLLRSPTFELQPGSSAFLLVQHLDEWSAKEKLALIKRATLEDRRSSRALWFGMHVGVVLLLILFFLVFAFVLRFPAALGYSLLFGLALVSNLHYDGFLFVALHPTAPELFPSISAWLAVSLQSSIALFLYLVLPLRPRHWPIHVLTAFLLGTWLTAALVDATSSETVYKSQLLPVAIGTLCVFYLTLSTFSVVRRAPGAALIVVGIALMLLRTITAVVAELALVDLSIFASNAIIPVLLVIDGLVFAALLVVNAIKLRKDRDAARDAELVALQRQLDFSAAQLAAEHERDAARQLAEQNRERLQVASHDLRQPLTALRASLSELQGTAPKVGSTLKASVDYLDSVLDSSLRTTAPDPSEIAREETVKEPIAVQTLFDNLYRMFRSEAEARGVKLHCVASSVVVVAEPIELIRMLSNLVSNAVKYSAGGRVVVGVRRKYGHYAIEVWDNGQGMSEEELKRVLRPYERGTKHGIEGEGLGLDIVKRLAESAQLAFTALSWKGRGSVFRISGLTPYA